MDKSSFTVCCGFPGVRADLNSGRPNKQTLVRLETNLTACKCMQVHVPVNQREGGDQREREPKWNRTKERIGTKEEGKHRLEGN